MINDFVNDDEINERSEESEFPGYPHYPASDDITHPANGVKKVDADLESMNRSVPGSGVSKASVSERLDSVNPEEEPDDDLIIVPGTEADVTAEDLILLGPKDRDMDIGDDETLRGNVQRTSLADEDLDVPGSELDDANESIGEEDEENNYYSLGGDNKDALEEDNQQ